ncbi:MAG: RluA family pseudouridine synthase [Pyrinomonadaceae bacterium]|nr:RluA family pseudouridine synthase [Pyrinomonadaceae bacterium]
MTRFEFQIDERFHRRRLDEFLFNEFRSMSKAYLRRVVKEENCELNGIIANSGTILKQDDFVEIEVNIDYEKGMSPEEMPLEIVYEDAEFLVVDKAVGMLVHPTNYERDGTLLNALTHYLNRNKSIKEEFVRPHLIHRLDRETSGLILVATNLKSSKKLSEHFKRRLFKKGYVALVDGIVENDQGIVDEPIGRFEELREWNVMSGGKPSESRFVVIERFRSTTLVKLEPVTGRTNQLRIHCAFLGHPIVGDKRYGGSEFERMCLHASEIRFWHPNGGEQLEFKSENLTPFRIEARERLS